MKVFIILSVAFFVSTDAFSTEFFSALHRGVKTATPSNIHPHGAPISVMTYTTNQSVTVNYDEIDNIFLHPEVRDRKIVVISIIGAFRKGKSFFMDYCLRFMYAHYKSVNFPNNTLDNKSDWIGSPEAPLIGFSWKAGSHRDTSGIVMWSDVFLHENLAIVLVDTQGIFDAKFSPANNFRIFAIGTLVSSFQIINLNDVIKENQLEYLQMATDYAKFDTNRSGGSTGKPFQSLLFLMRDGSSSQIFPYGFEGGQLYLSDVLQIKDDQSPELRDVRNNIKTSFENVHYFLMPHPGLEVVSDRNYDGRFSRLEHKFQENLKELLEWMLDSKNLKIKTVLGSEVTGHDFNKYLKSHFETFQSLDTTKTTSIYGAMIEKQLENYVQKSVSNYKTGIKEFEPNFTSKNFTDELADTHNKLKALVITQYKAARKIASIEHDQQYEDILVKDIAAYYMQWRESMVYTHNKLVEMEAENQRKIQEIQKIALAEKIKLKMQSAERELQLQRSFQLQLEESQETIRILQSETLASRMKAEEALQQVRDAKQKIEVVIRDRDTDIAMMKSIRELEKQKALMRLQLEIDRQSCLEQKRRDVEEKTELRRMEQECLDREDAYRKEHTESIEHRGQLELEERQKMIMQFDQQIQDQFEQQEREERWKIR